MKAPELIKDLERAGVRLWLDGDRLRFRAPKGVMTDDRKSLVGRHRDDVIATLRRGVLPAAVADPEHAEEPFPLTDVQAAYLMGRHGAYELGGVGCHSYVELAFPGLDPQRLERSWQQVIDRHAMLRAVVSRSGEQRVLTDTPAYRVVVTDVREASPEGVADALAAVRAALDHRVYEPEQWPLFTLQLTRCPGRDVLHLSVDMLIADFVSIHLLLTDLDRCYVGKLPGAPTVTFRDYVVAERRVAATSDYERSRAYWWGRLDDLPPAPELPQAGDGAPTPEPPRGVQPRFTRHTTTLDPEAWKGLREKAARRGITPSAAVLGAYAEVVARWSRSPRFTLNLTLQGRLPLCDAIDELVGDFTSILPLAVDGRAHSTFADRVRAVSEQLFDDLDHRVFPGVEVLREVARRRGQAEALMPIVFTGALGLHDAATSGGLTGSGEVVYGVSQTPQVRLDCQAMEHRGSLVVNWDVRDGVFPDQMIDEAFAAFSTLLDTLASGDSWDATSPIMLPLRQQRERALVNAVCAAPTGLLHDPVLAQAQRRPDAVAVIDQDRSITYAALVASARHLAATLNDVESRRSAGHPLDDAGAPVAVLVDKGVDQIIAVLGVLMAGRAYLPIDHSQPRVRRDAILADAGVRVGVTGSPHLDLPLGVVDLRVVAPGCAEHATAPDRASADATAYVIYTSGSTGTPKGVLISHRAARSTIDDVVARLEAGPDERVLGLASLGFDLSVFDIFGTLGAGGTLVLPDPDRRGDPSHWAQVVAGHRVTVWNSVPAQLQMLGQFLRSQSPVDRPVCTSLRRAVLSGDWIPTSLPGEIGELLPDLQLIGMGGATEAGIWSNWYPIGAVPEHWRSIPYGAPLDAHRFQIRDAAGQECPDWVAGELHIGGHGLADGYLGDSDRTASAFIEVDGERLYRTGDVARWLPGGVVEFLGREDTQVKIRGHRIELTEVESALRTHPAVEAAAVIADGTALSRRLVAFVVPMRDGSSTSGPLPTRAEQDASAVLVGADPERLSTFATALDQAALLSMAHALRALGLFACDTDCYTTDELLSASGAAPRNRRVVRRWLTVLQDHGLLRRDGDERWHDLTEVDVGAREQAWDELEFAHRGLDDGAELVAFLRSCAARLPQIVEGADSALALLFPHGDVSTANAAYRDNIISRYVNRGVTSLVSQIAAAHPGTLRVLEVGAGVGGTTAEVLPAIAKYDVDYLFTDLSHFFLGDAQSRFAAHPGLRYALFDMNTDTAEQGFQPGSFDVVLCANVLHNALDADVVTARLRDLLAPGGHLVFIETVKENYSVMMSMEFLMTFAETERSDFADARQGRDRIFLAREEWLDVLKRASGTVQACFPDADGTLAQFGQAVFAVQFGAATSGVLSGSSLVAHLRERLPEPMLPSRVEILERLPLTSNGKVDRVALRARVPGTATSGAAVREAPRDDLERRVAGLWAGLLGVEAVGREDDFFELGGDSLLLSRLAEQLRTQLPEAATALWEELIPQLLRRPTVAALVAHLRTRTRRLPIVPLRGEAATDQPLRVLVHDGSATLVPYRALIAELGGDVALVGVAPTDLEAYLARPGAHLVRDVAADYAELLAEHREIELVGYCMGGMIALELARALDERGSGVRRLTVISSHRVPYLVHDEGLVEYGFARLRGLDPSVVGLPSDAAALGAAVRERLSESGVIQGGSLDDHLGVYSARPREERLAALARAAGEPASRLELGLRIFAHSINAVASWSPEPYDGAVTFVRQSSREAFLPGVQDEPTTFWRELCTGELSVVDVPGDHFSCVQAPQVAAVAAVIGAPRP